MAPIAVGNSLPEGTISYFDADDKLQEATVHSLAAGKKVILFGVPGAFTPTCRYVISSSLHNFLRYAAERLAALLRMHHSSIKHTVLIVII